jgi:hypothetical protein
MIKLLLALSLLANAAVSESDRATMAVRNAMPNPGAENGKVGWVVSTGSFNASSATPLEGNASFTWDASASTQTLSSSFAVPEWLKGQNAVASCRVRCASGTCTHSLQPLVAGLAQATVAITSSTTASPRVTANFIAPTSGNIGLQFLANANEPELKIDSCIITRADEWNLSQVSQATFYGSLRYATTANCQWSVSSASAFTSFPADTDCPTATVTGSVTAPTTKVPGVRLQNLPAGTYQFVVTGFFQKGNAASEEYALRFFDGTNGFSQQGQISASDGGQTSLQGFVTYTTTQSDITVQLQAIRNGANALLIRGDTRDFEISVYRFPSSTETAARVDTLPASWSGYHDSTCSWTRTNTSYGDPAADATCALVEQTNANFGTVTSYLSGSDRLPGIVFTPSRAGRYLVLADFQTSGSSAGVALGFRLETSAGTLITEGSHLQSASSGNYETKYSLKGIVNPTSVAPLTLRIQCKAASGNCQIVPAGAISTISWSVIALDQSFPSPILFSANCSVRLDTGNGYGATGTAIRRYTNSSTVGNCITYADNSNSGMSLTINSSGVYTIDWSAKRAASAANIGISVNASSLTTTPDALTVANGNLGYKTIAGTTGDFGNISKTKYLNAGDVVRVFANGNVANDALEIVNITKVGD